MTIPQIVEQNITDLFCEMQLFRSVPVWKTSLCVIEGPFLVPYLMASQASVLERELAANNEYIALIPCTWIAVNVLEGLFLDTYLV